MLQNAKTRCLNLRVYVNEIPNLRVQENYMNPCIPTRETTVLVHL